MAARAMSTKLRIIAIPGELLRNMGNKLSVVAFRSSFNYVQDERISAATSLQHAEPGKLRERLGRAGHIIGVLGGIPVAVKGGAGFRSLAHHRAGRVGV